MREPHDIIETFINDLKARDDVRAIILFGSRARGNHRIDSDVDLIVILDEGFERVVEIVQDQAFEIIYTTRESAVEYWKSHKDDVVEFWKVAKVLHDRDGTGAALREIGLAIMREEKPALTDAQLRHAQWDLQDQLKAASSLVERDHTTALLILHSKMRQLLELYFDVRRLWTPSLKSILATLRERDAELAEKVEEFYASDSVEEKISITKQVIDTVFTA